MLYLNITFVCNWKRTVLYLRTVLFRCNRKINDDGNYVYFNSAKRCYKDLRFMINIIFQDDLEIIDVKEFRNFNDKLVGYSIIGKIEVK